MNFIACDLGGTKVLLGLYKSLEDGKPILIKKEKYISQDWNSFDSILETFLNNNCDGNQFPKKACFAIAGPIINNSSNLTNLSWFIEGENIRNKFNLDTVELINDFAVLIYGIPFLNNNQYKTLQKGNNLNTKNNYFHTIVGAGTGLGIARGLIFPNKIEILCSEGGHNEFAPRSSKEWELKEWIKSFLKLDRISSERIISGEGLTNIAEWRFSKSDANYHPFKEILEASRDSQKLRKKIPAEICKISNQGDKLMREIENTWISAYASLLGDIAIHELCFGGLWIGGGTAPKHIKNFSSNAFMKHFCNKGRYKDIVKSIPVKVILDEEFGLHSAACRAMML